MTDHIEKLLKVKRESRKTMEKARDRCKTVASRGKWSRWIEKNDKEIAALENVQTQLAGLQAVKRAEREACAAVAAGFAQHPDTADAAPVIAAAIRARN